MKLCIKGRDLSDFCVVVEEGFLQGETAKSYLSLYLSKITSKRFKETSAYTIQLKKGEKDDGFSIKADENQVVICGGKRGVIYGAFALLEKFGCRFFTPDLEVLPEKSVDIPSFELEENTPIYFRDLCANSGDERTWGLKNRLTSHLWGRRMYSEAEGGGFEYAGPQIAICHSLTGDALLSDCVETHPEYFSYKDGKRWTDRFGQICMTNEDAWQAAAKKAVEYLETSPGKPIVSVSQGDNGNFCECENCKKLVEKQGLPKTYFDVVNKIAAKIQETHPEAIVHTLGYLSMEAGLGDDYKLHDNIMVQYCESSCTNHSLLDPNCGRNKIVLERVKRWTKLCNNVWVWSYVNCFKYELLNFPDLFNYLENIRVYADLGVKGFFCEGEHTREYQTDFVGMHELKSYLLAKAMGNPYMTKEAYRTHMEEFCEAFYGKGYQHVIAYLELMRDCAVNAHHSYDCLAYGEDWEIRKPFQIARVVEEEKTAYFIENANKCIDEAEKLADSEQKRRLDKIRTEILYYDQFWNMPNIMQNGSAEEKEKTLAKNAELIYRIINQRLKITFWGKTRITQDAQLLKCLDVPPSEWDYSWN